MVRCTTSCVAFDNQRLNQLVPEIFTYTYRDTDPIEEELGKLFDESYNDDFIDPETEAPRQRYGETVGLLKQERSSMQGRRSTDWASRGS